MVHAMVTVLRTPARPMLVDQPRVHMELSMKNMISRFVKDESGATAIEYGLIAAGISLAIIAVVNGLGSTLNTKFSSINSSLK
jgi:pilus assembly protein Flp/PilA